MSEAVDVVAQAIQKLDTTGDWPWGKLSDAARDLYRRMAQAAIESLQLTQEWAIQSGPHIVRAGMTKENAEAKSVRWPESFAAVSRLVSPWVCSEDTADD